MGKIGGYFVFVALAGVVIISWVINWIFWNKKICCCRLYHNPTTTGIFWWSAFIFLCGIIACCISGFVTTHRFGKMARAVKCAYERIYYDSKFGQMKDSSEKWEGLEIYSQKLGNSQNLLNNIEGNDDKITELLSQNENEEEWKTDEKFYDDNSNYKFKGQYYKDYLTAIKTLLLQLKEEGSLVLTEDNSKIFFEPKKPGDTSTIVGQFISQTNQIVKLYEELEESIMDLYLYGNADSINEISDKFENISKDLQSYKDGYLDDVNYYVKVAKGCGQILVIIYLSILCLISILGCAVLMAYTYLKKQPKLDIIMHVIWNSIKFFSFSFFMYGAAFGMLHLGLRDIISYNKYLFGEDNLSIDSETYVLPKNEAKDFLRYCLADGKNDYSAELDSYSDVNNFFNNFYELKSLLQNHNITLNSKFNDTYYVIQKYNLIRNLQDFSDSSEYSYPIGSIEPSGIPKLFSLPKKEQVDMVNKLSSYFDKIVETLNISDAMNEEENSLNSLDCGFLKSDVAMVYNTLYDASIESRILCVLSCCIAFFGEIAVYFYLLSMYHFDKTIFKEGNIDYNINRRPEKRKFDDETSKNSFMGKFSNADWKKNNMKLDRQMKKKN